MHLGRSACWLAGRCYRGVHWDEIQDDLTYIRLAILDSQGRFDEYLNLAAAANRVVLHATMLARLGRVQERWTSDWRI